MLTPKRAPRSTAVMGNAPATTYRNLIVRYAHRDAGDFAFFYEESAKRLASTFNGKPEDDIMLLPFLYLYRQAVELRLKSHIQYFASIRMTYVDGVTPELRDAASAEWLRKRFGHKLDRLLAEAKVHYEALSEGRPFASEMEQFVLAFHEDDATGVGFRYAGNLPDVQESADFPALVDWLDTGFTNLSLLEDEIDGVYSHVPTLRDQTD